MARNIETVKIAKSKSSDINVILQYIRSDLSKATASVRSKDVEVTTRSLQSVASNAILVLWMALCYEHRDEIVSSRQATNVVANICQRVVPMFCDVVDAIAEGDDDLAKDQLELVSGMIDVELLHRGIDEL